LQQHKPEQAIQRLNQRISKYPSIPAFYEILGLVYVNQKNYGKAEESYRKALSLDSNRSEIYSLLGELYLAQNSLDKAIQEFETSRKLHPKSVPVHILLGTLNGARNANDQAEFHYREALKLDPQATVPNNNLAWLLAESGSNLDEALRLAQVANDKTP